MERLKPFLPKSHGKPRVDDRRVLGGIIFINRNGLRWCDAPKAYGPAKTRFNRWKRWSDNGVFARIMMGLAAGRAEHKTIMIDATCLKAHRTASGLRVKRGARTADWAHQGRHEHQAARRRRCERPADRVLPVGRSSQRPYRRGGAAGLPSRKRTGCWRTGVTMPIGSEKH